jgi:hypothetical protein
MKASPSFRVVWVAAVSASVGCGELFDIDECNDEAENRISRAHSLVATFWSSLEGKLGFLSGRERRMRSRWNLTRVRCIDSEETCQNDSGLFGLANGWGNEIRVCWNNLRQEELCDLVNVLVHEKAHTDKVPVLPGHSAPDDFPWVRRFDPVYRAGEVAAEECRTRWNSNGIPLLPSP